MLKGAIFDVDGTLIDSLDAHARAWSRALAEHGHPVPPARIREQSGLAGDAILTALLDETAYACDGEAIASAHARFLEAEPVQPFAHAQELLEALHARKIRTALASASTGPAQERCRTLLGGADLVDAAGEAGAPSDMFQAAMDSLIPLDREHALAFGATPSAVKAATHLGLRMVALRCGGFGDAELEEAGALAVFDDAADLLARLDAVLLLV